MPLPREAEAEAGARARSALSMEAYLEEVRVAALASLEVGMGPVGVEKAGR